MVHKNSRSGQPTLDDSQTVKQTKLMIVGEIPASSSRRNNTEVSIYAPIYLGTNVRMGAFTWRPDILQQAGPRLSGRRTLGVIVFPSFFEVGGQLIMQPPLEDLLILYSHHRGPRYEVYLKV
jgi:hypothetical protein